MVLTAVIISGAFLAVTFCALFWWHVLHPATEVFLHGHVIADFRREISAWEHDQSCR